MYSNHISYKITAIDSSLLNPWNKLSKEEAMAGKTSSFKSNFDKMERDTRRGIVERGKTNRFGVFSHIAAILDFF